MGFRASQRYFSASSDNQDKELVSFTIRDSFDKIFPVRAAVGQSVMLAGAADGVKFEQACGG